jgi:hypothetical protein
MEVYKRGSRPIQPASIELKKATKSSEINREGRRESNEYALDDGEETTV